MAEINVTPLVDVMLVLLIIFMVTAPLLTAGVPVNLPTAAPRRSIRSRSRSRSRSTSKGQIFVDNDEVTEAPARQRSRRSRGKPARRPKPPQIFLRADKPPRLWPVMRVMGELNRAGLNRVALVTAQASNAPTAKGPGSDTNARKLRQTGSLLGDNFLKGVSDRPSTSRSVTPQAPTMNAQAMADIGSAIKRQVQPCADRQVKPGPGAERIVVTIRLRLNRDGSLASNPVITGHSGVDDENSRYRDRVDDNAIATFKGCSPLRGLPQELYDVEHGWSVFTMRYNLKGWLGRELAQIVTNDLKQQRPVQAGPAERAEGRRFPEVTAPSFDYWGGAGAQALVQGYVRANGNGTLTVGCYLYDVFAQQRADAPGLRRLARRLAPRRA
jgi:biopolymer transport protein ExbD